MNHNETLNFVFKLTDQISGPLKGVNSEWKNTTRNMHQGFGNLGMGAAGLAATAYGINKSLEPARDMERVLGELSSLDVDDQVLKTLANESLKYSIQFGESATAMVGSAYDIQSAISGLTGKELAGFTRSSNILAKATKADASTITDYVGTMYGIFQNQATAMGKAAWVDQLTGQTAKAVQMFKTDGAKMSSAFAALGANATSSGIQLNEQIAVMGTMQATMSGSESATKYRAFLGGVGKAQEALGLTFTDSNGKMLPMVKILNAIKGKYGEIDTVAKSDMLQKAFGSNEAVALVKLLSTNVDGLGTSINQLGEIKGLGPALTMARKQVDPWEQFDSAIMAVSISFGRAFLPVINPVIASMAEILGQATQWADMFPNVAKALSIAAMSVLELIATYAALTIALAIGRIFLAGWSLVLMVANAAAIVFRATMLRTLAVMSVYRAVMFAVAVATAAHTGLMWLAALPLKAYGGIVVLVNAALSAYHATIWLATIAMKALRVAMLACSAATIGVSLPFLVAIAAIAATIAVVGALIYWWDDLVALFRDLGVIDAVSNAFTSLAAYWDKLKSAFANVDVFSWLEKALNGVIDKIKNIPGIGLVIDSIKSAVNVDEFTHGLPTVIKVDQVSQTSTPAANALSYSQTIAPPILQDLAQPPATQLSTIDLKPKRQSATAHANENSIIGQLKQSVAAGQNANTWNIHTNEFDISKMQHQLALEA